MIPGVPGTIPNLPKKTLKEQQIAHLATKMSGSPPRSAVLFRPLPHQMPKSGVMEFGIFFHGFHINHILLLRSSTYLDDIIDVFVPPLLTLPASFLPPSSSSPLLPPRIPHPFLLAPPLSL